MERLRPLVAARLPDGEEEGGYCADAPSIRPRSDEPQLELSFRGARSASPESITRQGLWIPGLRQEAHPGMTIIVFRSASLRAQASPLGMYFPMTHLYLCNFHS
jgi:hypothetical protein